MIRRPPRSTLDRSSAASDVYKRQRFSYEIIDSNTAVQTSKPEVGEKDKNYLKEIFSLSSDNAITSISNFKKLQKEGHDFSFWVNYEAVSYTHLRSPRDRTRSRMPSSA